MLLLTAIPLIIFIPRKLERKRVTIKSVIVTYNRYIYEPSSTSNKYESNGYASTNLTA